MYSIYVYARYVGASARLVFDYAGQTDVLQLQQRRLCANVVTAHVSGVFERLRETTTMPVRTLCARWLAYQSAMFGCP